MSWERPESKLGCRTISDGGVFQLIYSAAKIAFLSKLIKHFVILVKITTRVESVHVCSHSSTSGSARIRTRVLSLCSEVRKVITFARHITQGYLSRTQGTTKRIQTFRP
jgi:hypothetical protein